MNKFNRITTEIIQGLNNFANIVFTFFNTFSTTFLLLVISITLIIVEVPRVKHGIAFFEEDESIALGGAIVIVLALFVSKMLVVNISYERFGEEFAFQEKPSLRKTFDNFLYFLGFWRGEGKRYTNDIDLLKNLNSAIIFAIYVLAIAGSLDQEILIYTEANLRWHEAIIEILVNSSPAIFFNVILTFVFTRAVAIAANVSGQYIAFKASRSSEKLISKVEEQKRIENKNYTMAEFFKNYKPRTKQSNYEGLNFQKDRVKVIEQDDGSEKFELYDGLKEEVVGEYVSIDSALRNLNEERLQQKKVKEAAA